MFLVSQVSDLNVYICLVLIHIQHLPTFLGHALGRSAFGRRPPKVHARFLGIYISNMSQVKPTMENFNGFHYTGMENLL